MEELSRNLSEPAWWFSSVLVALLINLLTPKLQGLLSKSFERASESWRNRNEKSKAKFAQEVEKLVNSQQHLATTVEEEMRDRLRAIHMVSMACILFVIYVAARINGAPTNGFESKAMLALAFIPLILSIATFRSAMDSRIKILAARRAISKNESKNLGQ